MHEHGTDLPSDAELRARTAAIVARAEAMAAELARQNERLAATLDLFREEVVVPLRYMSEDNSGECNS